jgi:hypothetical protein
VLFVNVGPPVHLTLTCRLGPWAQTVITPHADIDALTRWRTAPPLPHFGVGDLWHKTGDAFAVVFGDMALEELLLNEVM